MKLHKKNYFILLTTTFFLISCHKTGSNNTTSPPPTPPTLSCTATTSLSYGSGCTTDGGCNLVFTCPLQSSRPLAKFFNSLTKKIWPSKVLTASTAQLTITSMTTVDEPALFQSTAGLVPESWYSASTTIQCINDNEEFTCSQFGPVGSKFDIVGTLGDANLTLHVAVVNDVSPIADTAADLIGGCGQFGTTYQRMFDCSERVTNFAGIGQGGDPSVPFILGDPDPNWFLVACPVFSGATTSQQCSWLSPVIEAGNPSIGINKNPPNTGTQDSTSPDIGPGAATRILWSGLLNNNATYTFWQAVGTDSSGRASCNGNTVNGQCAQYNSGSPTYTFNTFITMSASTPNLSNACAARLAANDNAFSGMITFPWIMPSYPILMTITGGPSCAFGTTDTTCNGQGFSAMSIQVPSFLSDNSDPSFLWSASVFSSTEAFQFYAVSGPMNAFNSLNILSGVRCVSTVW